MGVPGIFFESLGQPNPCFSVLTFSPEFNACHDKSMHSFLTYSVGLLMMGSEWVGALGEGSNFQLVRGPQNWVLRHLQAEGAV